MTSVCVTYCTLAESPLNPVAAWSILASVSASERPAAAAGYAIPIAATAAQNSANSGLHHRIECVSPGKFPPLPLRREPFMAG